MFFNRKYEAYLWADKRHDVIEVKAKNHDDAIRQAMYHCAPDVTWIELRANGRIVHAHILEPAPISDEETANLIESFDIPYNPLPLNFTVELEDDFDIEIEIEVDEPEPVMYLDEVQDWRARNVSDDPDDWDFSGVPIENALDWGDDATVVSAPPKFD